MKPRFLIGYSACPLTRAAFEAADIDAWTCDLLPARDGSDRHFQCDIWEVAEDNWDGALFHPMCTNMTVSAAWAFMDPDYDRYPGVGYHQKVKPETLTGAARGPRQGYCELQAPSGPSLPEGDREPCAVVIERTR